MCSSATFLHFLSLTPNSLSILKPSAAALTLKTIHKSASVSSLFPLKPVTASRFARNVAVSSQYAQEEDDLSSYGGREREQRFSPDLKLFVGNLPFTADSASLAGLFERVGNVEMVEVIYDKITGRSRGFGFVTMSTVEEVEAASQQFNGYELDGRPLRVNAGAPPQRNESSSRAPRSESSFRDSNSPRSRPSFDSSNRLYVGNLSWGVDDSALETLFSEQGKVLDAKVIYDRDSGRSKGFGFVTYGSVNEVNNAVESLDGADLDGRSIRVSIAEARPPRRQF